MTSEPLDLAVAMCTKDSMRTIRRSLDSVSNLAKRIVTIDSGSSDGTVEFCKEYGATVIHRDWPGHAAQRQFALDQCKENRWVLLLDSDESLEPELAQSIRQTVEQDNSEYDGWWMNRKVWFLDGWLNYMFQPEWRLRLVRGGKATVTGTVSHDELQIAGSTDYLKGDLRHDSWEDLSDMCQRNLAYAKLAAENEYTGGSILNIFINPALGMFKQLILKRGIFDGKRGFLAAAGLGAGTLMKHLMIAQRRFSSKAKP